MACGILVPEPGIEPESPAVEAQSLNDWTAREVPAILEFIFHVEEIINKQINRQYNFKNVSLLGRK